MSRWIPAYVGVGCNVGDCKRRFQDARLAVERLEDCVNVVTSPAFRTAPVGVVDQPTFLNGVIAFLTRVPATTLLTRLLGIEVAAGRRRASERRWGPRTLDLDLLVYGRVQLDSETLTLPHPRIAERNFVLLPLVEVAPGLEIPGVGPVSRLAGRTSRTGVRRIEDFTW